jgi:hypothetical protein
MRPERTLTSIHERDIWLALAGRLKQRVFGGGSKERSRPIAELLDFANAFSVAVPGLIAARSSGRHWMNV